MDRKEKFELPHLACAYSPNIEERFVGECRAQPSSKVVGDHPRRAQMIRRRVGDARRLRKLRRILRDQLPGGIDEDGRLGVRLFFDALALTVLTKG
ncbi:MAG TPA: hypothetical protein PLN05_14055 [Pyrinomonadaceae bacterium]|nr:hypothetical protein [Chloracidobacterium sp.]HRJ87049.1 hypothetical protein [Pyrinomonadaceae bacterium]HRK51546.1 hypothetical protein [Pyrinomonadaceae bacterium]